MINEPKCPFCGKHFDKLVSRPAHMGTFRGTCYSCDQVVWAQDRTQYETRIKAFLAKRQASGSPWKLKPKFREEGSKVIFKGKKEFNPSSR